MSEKGLTLCCVFMWIALCDKYKNHDAKTTNEKCHI